MNEALRLAIRGGYEIPEHLEQLDYADIQQDPKFWQALERVFERDVTDEILEEDKPYWLELATHYFKLLLTGGDVDAFWKKPIGSRSEATEAANV